VLLHHIKQSLHLHAIARHAVVARLDLIRWSVREEMAQVALQVVAVVLVVSSSRSSSSSRVVVAGEQQYGTPLDSLSWYDFGKMFNVSSNNNAIPESQNKFVREILKPTGNNSNRIIYHQERVKTK
jgi:hypothetical protein